MRPARAERRGPHPVPRRLPHQPGELPGGDLDALPDVLGEPAGRADGALVLLTLTAYPAGRLRLAQPRRIVRRRPARRPGRVHGRRSGPVERRRAGRHGDRSRIFEAPGWAWRVISSAPAPSSCPFWSASATTPATTARPAGPPCSTAPSSAPKPDLPPPNGADRHAPHHPRPQQRRRADSACGTFPPSRWVAPS